MTQESAWPTRTAQRRLRPLPWLSTPAIVLLAILSCLPFGLTEIPPLVDLPGHIGAAAVEAAAPDSPLPRFFAWHWTFTLNMGGEVIMAALTPPFGPVQAGWCVAVLATGCLVAGLAAVVRALNPHGAYGLGWALVFVFAFPWVWGFLNFILATGVSLGLFAVSLRLRDRPLLRWIVVGTGAPLALLCHAIGGILLPILVASEAVGAALDKRERRPLPVRRVGLSLAPFLPALALLIMWKVQAPADQSELAWDWAGKSGFVFQVLRDQSLFADTLTMIGCCGLLIWGLMRKARWSWRQGLPVVALLILYAMLPARINGSEAVDTRVLPVVFMLALGLQDWSEAGRKTAMIVAWGGAAILAARLFLIAIGFTAYAKDYRQELVALQHVPQGSRIFSLHEQPCTEVSWRMPRLDTLASMAAVYRGSWTNSHWTIPGLHMMEARFDPGGATKLSAVWPSECAGTGRQSLNAAFAGMPLDNIDYVWLIDTGVPPVASRRLKLIWQADRSALFQVCGSGVGSPNQQMCAPPGK